jgi:hypothetical protein
VKNDMAFKAGYLLGHVFVAALLIGAGIWLGHRLGARNDPPGFVRWPVIAAVILLLLAFVGSQQQPDRSGQPAVEGPR